MFLNRVCRKYWSQPHVSQYRNQQKRNERCDQCLLPLLKNRLAPASSAAIPLKPFPPSIVVPVASGSSVPPLVRNASSGLEKLITNLITRLISLITRQQPRLIALPILIALLIIKLTTRQPIMILIAASSWRYSVP